MGLFRKKEVPDQLPNLAIDEIHDKIATQSEKRETKLNSLSESFSRQRIPSTLSKPDLNKEKKDLPRAIEAEDEEGYFKDLIKNITQETEDLDKLDSWYKDKFLPGDVVFNMREYWEKQQPKLLLKNVSGDLKTKLLDKTDRLHELEKEWQNIYFTLLSKEEEIRREEKELKEALTEFIDVYKKSIKRREERESE